VCVGRGSLIGSGAVVLPKTIIGDNAVVGAGAVVTKDVPDSCLVLGNPAQIVGTGLGQKGNL
jgi:acetyltransferase-like isoleucine patch superfamily enzyme